MCKFQFVMGRLGQVRKERLLEVIRKVRSLDQESHRSIRLRIPNKVEPREHEVPAGRSFFWGDSSMPRSGVEVRRTRWRVLSGVALAFGLASWQPAAHAQTSGEAEVAKWFTKPYDLPRDVFDLPEFNRFRQGNHLDFDHAEAYLEGLSDKNLPATQRLFDIFAWRALLALNWPADASGAPDPTKGFADQSTPKVWEYWEPTSAVFKPDGSEPTWQRTNQHALDHFKAGWRMGAPVNEGLQAFSGPLIDQNGQWVHYVSFLNRVEFDYLVQFGLYYLEGQEAYLRNHPIAFPQGDDSHYGSIEIKLAWKVLTPEEVRSQRFLVRELPVVTYRPAEDTVETPPAHKTGRTADNGANRAVLRKTVGLIGMHISMRTRSSPQWIWATFEQIDNTRLDRSSGDAAHPLPTHPSLSNPNNPYALVGANVLPAYNAVGPNGALNDWDESKPLPPVEVLRLVPPPQGTAEVNAAAQSFLAAKGSVFRYYELNGTQWPTHPTAPAVPGGMPGGVGSAPQSISFKMPGEVVPVYLTNATMETYFQHGFQAAAPLEQDNRTSLPFDTTMVFGTESCAGCHYSAGACIGFRRDVSGKLLHDAKGQKIPIFGENGNGGLTGNANFSWLLQLEAHARNPKE
jgi:hypothetical protein